MAVPKCKVSKARRDKRRGSNWKLSAPSVAVCPKCGEPVPKAIFTKIALLNLYESTFLHCFCRKDVS